jgi:hypothetical protein
MTNHDPSDYASLSAVLQLAYEHASAGKGRERHANDLSFDQQPMMQIARAVGVGFPLGQAMKKIQESAGMIERGQDEAAIAELLGAINYCAGAIVHIKSRDSA